MVNIAKKLKNVKEGTTLWSPLFGPVTLVDAGQMIYVETNDGRSECFDENGRYFLKGPGCCYSVDCLLFPAQGQTWGGVEIKHPYKKKFEVGDWITDGLNPPVKVSGFSHGFTYYFSEGNITAQGWKVAEDNYHIWTLKDAKPGDVLAFDWAEENGHLKKDGSDKWQKIVIFKALNGNNVEGYGCTFVNNKLAFVDVETPYYSKTWSSTLKPATQAQRDLLFETMKKAGHVWDSDKKEVVKCDTEESNVNVVPVEPKYKLGDWVVYCGNVYQVTDIGETTYTFTSAKTGADFINDIVKADNSRNFRRWHVSDALSGDVLIDYAAGLDNPLIFMLKFFEHVDFGLGKKSDYSSYCYLKASTRQEFMEGKYHHKHDIKPATHEQRELLFMKMDEAGYYWNEETKELLKYPPTKFKAGNWIVPVDKHDSSIFYVSKALKDTYMLTDINGNEFKKSRYNIEKNYCLWNINDAQNGDVLAAHEVIVLFKEIDGLNIRTHLSYHYMNNPMVFTNDLHNKKAFSPATKDERERLFKKIAEEGYKWDNDEKELKQINYNAGKFNVGDWITDGNSTVQITSIGNGWYLYGERRKLGDIKDIDETYHLWSIEDAKPGDVLAGKIDGDNYILLFKQIKDNWVETYGHYYDNVDRFCVPTQLFCREYQGTLHPADNEQADLLFRKLHEAGYLWYPVNKELCKIVKPKFEVGQTIWPTAESHLPGVKVDVIGIDTDRQYYVIKQKGYAESALPFKYQDKYCVFSESKSHYDISNFKPFDKVLVRDGDKEPWRADFFEEYDDNFYCFKGSWEQCIPFNDDTKHLLGKVEECDKFYVNW